MFFIPWFHVFTKCLCSVLCPVLRSTDLQHYNALYCNLCTNVKMDQLIFVYIPYGYYNHAAINNSPRLLLPATDDCEQPTFLAHFAANMSLELRLIQIKVQASRIRNKLQIIKQINDGWNSMNEVNNTNNNDDHEFAAECELIDLQIEDATDTSEEVVTMTEQLLSNPPSYNSNPNEQRQRQGEVRILSGLLHEYVKSLEWTLKALKEQVNDALGTRMVEACLRVRQIHTEVHDVMTVAKMLRPEEGTQ